MQYILTEILMPDRWYTTNETKDGISQWPVLYDIFYCSRALSKWESKRNWGLQKIKYTATVKLCGAVWLFYVSYATRKCLCN